MHLRILTRMNVLFQLQMNKILEMASISNHMEGTSVWGRGHIRNVMKTIIILTQNILHLSV